uniref:VWFA domain-containing protein n=1 Tax=Anolis carolinensis TaxID=28377 RepID=H9GBR0_ANOCA|nr:PREDICTED: integrin alpha-M [Anolis carolinensis]|eukprot:XP_008113686.1 PREDICTED: integrin alpha-M [Anolis carolinensis]
MDSLPLLICVGAVVLTSCRGFSLDTENPIIFRENAKGFGQTVVQFGSGVNAGVFVGAPLQPGDVDETGKLYKCQPTQSKTGGCEAVVLQRPADAVNMSLSLSLSAQDSQLLVCGPTVQQTCGENIYLKGYCFLLDQNLAEVKRFPESLPECPKQPTDIVLLIDGSGSIQPNQFSEMKTFISMIMKRFQNTNTQFALSQYARWYREEFTFLDFQRVRNPDELLRPVTQLRGATLTATYIQRVVREQFVTEKGSRPGASKVLIVITDGEKSGDPLQYSDVIPEAERAGIIRFAIGVGKAFSGGTAKQELISIASQPEDDHVFPVDNFDALKDIQNKLQDKIFAIEGTQSKDSSSFQLEMSQEGFSALLTPDGPALGAVGAYDWSGGVFLYGSGGESSFINMSRFSKEMDDAYLGYSLQTIRLNGQSSYVLGAPRYQHAGKVVWFSQENGQWKVKSELSTKEPIQIGSYFGAALCSVDLDRDTNTDLVLIGAPMYYDTMAGGRVYICERKGESFLCSKELHGETNNPFGRFGASIAEIGEISGDRWTDVAVGAPMEDENRGTVYIFRGSRRSINQEYSQRIRSSQFANNLQYFGQAIGAGSDLTGDGLPDVAVGAEGQVLLLRSRPVLQVHSRITFEPSIIPLSAFECKDQGVLNKEISKATVCLAVKSDPRFTLSNSISSTIRYTLALDYGRSMIRAVFQGGSSTSTITEELQVDLRENCKDYRIKLPTCIEDSLTPLSLRLNYTLTGDPIQGSNNLRAILGEDEPRQFTEYLPFEKNCGRDGVCKDELKTSFNFSGLDTLVVGVTTEVNATVFIRNDGEDSYSTTLNFLYPSALSYRRFTLLKSNRLFAVIKCGSVPAAEDDPVGNSTCSINHPIFRSGAEVIFIATFSISQNADLGLEVQINATAGSENSGLITQDMIHQEKLPVKYAVYIFVNAIDKSTKYVNFSVGQENQNRTVEHIYEVKNTYQRKVNVSVVFQFPVELSETWVWNASLEFPKELSHLANCVPGKQTPGSKDFVKQLSKRPILDCSVATCKTVHCRIPSLEQQQPLQFTIKGDTGLKWLSQTQQKKVTLVSSAQIFYDENKYTTKKEFVQSQANTVLEHLVPYNYLPIIIGSSIGGLVLLALIIAALYKLGFFKRQYKAMMDEAGDVGNEAAGPSQDPTPPATKG